MTDVDCVELGTRHHQALLDIYNHYIRTSHVTFDLEAFSLEGRQPWFDQFDGARWQCVVAEYQGDAVGYACSTRFRPKAAYGTSVEASIYLHPDHTGRGLGPPPG